jgi:protein-S-isoprenylcysteine O-methyltransferase Ste14
VPPQTSDDQPREESGASWGVAKRLLLVAFSILLHGTLLFVSAGRLNWTMAWAFLGLYATNGIVIVLLINPDLMAERARTKADAKGWDKVLSGFLRLYLLTAPLVAGLDRRWGWSPQLPLAVQLAALVVGALGYGLNAWAITTNRFFSAVVRIQRDRGHAVVSTGPYQYVRHPGYVGSMMVALAIPLILGSLWAYVPAVLGELLFIVRTALEDRTLHEELDEYREYAQQTRYRLLPGIW